MTNLFRFLKMVRASLDRQIDTTVIVASCFPLVEQVATDRLTENKLMCSTDRLTDTLTHRHMDINSTRKNSDVNTHTHQKYKKQWRKYICAKMVTQIITRKRQWRNYTMQKKYTHAKNSDSNTHMQKTMKQIHICKKQWRHKFTHAKNGDADTQTRKNSDSDTHTLPLSWRWWSSSVAKRGERKQILSSLKNAGVGFLKRWWWWLFMMMMIIIKPGRSWMQGVWIHLPLPLSTLCNSA